MSGEDVIFKDGELNQNCSVIFLGVNPSYHYLEMNKTPLKLSIPIQDSTIYCRQLILEEELNL